MFTENTRTRTVWTPQEDHVVVGVTCTDDRWLAMRIDEITGQDEHHTSYVLDAAASP